MNLAKAIAAFLFGAGWGIGLMGYIFVDIGYFALVEITNVILFLWVLKHWYDGGG